MAASNSRLHTSKTIEGVRTRSGAFVSSRSLSLAVWTLKFTVLAAFAAGCSAKASGPPEIVVDRTACSHCTMLVSEVAYAAAYEAPGARARVFDDIGCMLEAMRRESLHSGASGLRVWFHDAEDSKWIEEGSAVFVVSSEIRTPMGGGIVAYRDSARAGQVAAKHQGRVVRTVPDLMTIKGEQR
jgi:copper chaperone NosL